MDFCENWKLYNDHKKSIFIDILSWYRQRFIICHLKSRNNKHEKTELKLHVVKQFNVCFAYRFALSDNAFRLLLEENRSQCILISGELLHIYRLTFTTFSRLLNQRWIRVREDRGLEEGAAVHRGCIGAHWQRRVGQRQAPADQPDSRGVRQCQNEPQQQFITLWKVYGH